ncbi:MAG: hypothetical protein ACE5GT_04305 [Rhodospirillales bacterium]
MTSLRSSEPMPYTLEEFAADCRQALTADPGPDGLEAVRRLVERALADGDFVAAHLGPQATAERQVLYEDPELGFCILAHVYAGPRTATPHDHGPAWAVYGQAEGTTEMSDWRLVAPPRDGAPGRVERVRTYSLGPGQAKVYQTGDIHSPSRAGPTRLIRIEGMNMDGVEREPFEPVA